jgi:hypothetical protein
MASAEYLDRQKLTNTLNYLHFKGDPVYAFLNHPEYDESVLIKVLPDPSPGEVLTCRWDETYTSFKLENYHLQYLIFPHGQSFVVVPARLIYRDDGGFTIDLPQTTLVVSRRQFPRYDCQDVKAQLWQNGFQAEGELLDFSPQAFRLCVQSAPPSSFHWFNSEEPSTIRLSTGDNIYYSGSCNCNREKQYGHRRELVLAPVHDRIKRFKSKTVRNPRRHPAPPFYAMFEHPFTKRKVQREILDISTSGISIQDKCNEAVLMPGMIIPDMTITYAGILKIQCRVQVIYRKDEELARFGLAVLDMDLKNYNMMSQLLNNITGTDQGMTNEVDPDELWELFFDTDFIYPAKYKYIHQYRETFQETYRKLYAGPQEIAKHFTCQKNGHIYSHVSLLRAYEKAWMIHHHAARPRDERYTGFIVLKQLIFYLNDARHLPSANMDYVFCYVQPEKKFNEKLYTDFTQAQNDLNVTSLDLFSYFMYEIEKIEVPLTGGWSLQGCSKVDLWEFEQFYKHHSGGLLWKMLSLDHQPLENPLENVYAKLGFIRKWKAFALHFSGILKAIIIAEQSDVAINLSDLMNGLKIFVMDPEVPPGVIFAAVDNLAKKDQGGTVPLMIYPSDYTKSKGLDSEKKYYLWILDVQHGDAFMKYWGLTYRIKFV